MIVVLVKKEAGKKAIIAFPTGMGNMYFLYPLKLRSLQTSKQLTSQRNTAAFY